MKGVLFLLVAAVCVNAQQKTTLSPISNRHLTSGSPFGTPVTNNWRPLARQEEQSPDSSDGTSVQNVNLENQHHLEIPPLDSDVSSVGSLPGLFLSPAWEESSSDSVARPRFHRNRPDRLNFGNDNNSDSSSHISTIQPDFDDSNDSPSSLLTSSSESGNNHSPHHESSDNSSPSSTSARPRIFTFNNIRSRNGAGSNIIDFSSSSDSTAGTQYRQSPHRESYTASFSHSPTRRSSSVSSFPAQSHSQISRDPTRRRRRTLFSHSSRNQISQSHTLSSNGPYSI